MSAGDTGRLTASVTAALAVGLLVSACGAGATVLEAASVECGAGVIGDDGRSLTLDMAGEDAGSGELTVGDVVCVLNELDVPDAVMTKMDSTSSNDGRQSDDWDGIEVSWKYHPDSALDVILEIE